MHEPYHNIPDIIGEFMKGYRAAKEPAAIRRQEEQERIANALKGLELNYAPQTYEDEALKRGLEIERGQLENKALPEDIRLRQLNDSLRAQGQYLTHDQMRQLIRHNEEEHPLSMAERLARIAESQAKANQLGSPVQSAYDKAKATAQAKADVEDANARAATLESTYNTGDLLGNYESIANNPNFDKVVGKINTAELGTSKWTGGNKDRLALQAQIDYISGKLKDEIIQGYKGAISNYEQQEALRRIPNYKDDPASFRSKMELMMRLNNSVQMRAIRIDDLRNQGYSKLDALKIAQKEIPLPFEENEDEYAGATAL